MPISKNQLLYIHLPKTAGTSLSAFLESQFPPGKSILHLENLVLGKPKVNPGIFADKHFLSAHLKFNTLINLLDCQNIFTITMLRNPLKQTLSHLAWMKRIGAPEHKKEFNRYPEYIQRAAERFHRLDIITFLDTMNDHERNFFDNCQTRYFLPVYGDIQLTENHLRQALASLNTIDFVAVTEELTMSILLLCFYLAWKPPDSIPRLNPSQKKYIIDPQKADDELNRRLEKIIRFDKVLYQHAQRIFHKQFRNMFRILQTEYPKYMRTSLFRKKNNLTTEELTALLELRAKEIPHPNLMARPSAQYQPTLPRTILDRFARIFKRIMLR